MLTSVSFSVFTVIRQVLMGWHPGGVRRARIRVIGVNFSEFFIKGKGILFEIAGNLRYPSPSKNDLEVG